MSQGWPPSEPTRGFSAEPNVHLSIGKCQKATSIPTDQTWWERLSRSHLCHWGHTQPPAWHPLCTQLWGFFFSPGRHMESWISFFKQL